ncbi:ATP-binding protein [Ferrovibrio sp.]|uniref:hybrid sensor histidine kinase/response regulator n=1 Tax=Ferrovibrio sp. TaxID=1917215 RepID=UPI0035B1923F
MNFYVHAVLRPQVEADEVVRMERRAQIHGQQIETVMLGLRATLEKLVLLYRMEGNDDRAIHNELRRLELETPHIRSLGITDDQGNLIHSSRSNPAPQVQLADRDYIRLFLDGARQPFFLGGPVSNKVDGMWQISMSMPVRDETGRLKAVITSVVDPDRFADGFSADHEGDDCITLIYSDMRVVVSYPMRPDEIGAAIPALPVLDYLQQEPNRQKAAGIYALGMGGETRILAARRLFDDRLTILASRPMAQAMQQWNDLSWLVAVCSVAILLLAAGTVFTARRLLQAEDRRVRALGSLNMQLQEQTARAERLAAAKSEFLATMSHEIRTPMNGVLGMAQALKNQPLSSEAAEQVSVIAESASSLLGVINDVLDYSRLEAGRMQIASEPMRLRPQIEAMRMLFASACAAKGLELRVKLPDSLPDGLFGDAARLRQILVNLLGNAVKFTEAGFVEIAVDRLQAATGWMLRIEVRDSGPGIAREAQYKMFERFSQEDSSTARRFGGTGLGLAITKRLVELQNGRIGCVSEKGQGALFWVELPWREPSAEMLAGSVAAEALPLPPSPHQPTPDGEPQDQAGLLPRLLPRLLVVDDNLVNRRTLTALLKPFGYEIDLAESGAVALEKLRGKSYQTVLLDIHMPDMDGFETLRALRRQPASGSRPPRVLAMTADVMPEAVLRYEAAGFDGVVAKPVIVQDLLTALNTGP